MTQNGFHGSTIGLLQEAPHKWIQAAEETKHRSETERYCCLRAAQEKEDTEHQEQGYNQFFHQRQPEEEQQA
jgi:hypothetical protein